MRDSDKPTELPAESLSVLFSAAYLNAIELKSARSNLKSFELIGFDRRADHWRKAWEHRYNAYYFHRMYGIIKQPLPYGLIRAVTEGAFMSYGPRVGTALTRSFGQFWWQELKKELVNALWQAITSNKTHSEPPDMQYDFSVHLLAALCNFFQLHGVSMSYTAITGGFELIIAPCPFCEHVTCEVFRGFFAAAFSWMLGANRTCQVTQSTTIVKGGNTHSLEVMIAL